MTSERKIPNLLDSLRDDLQKIAGQMQIFSSKVVENQISQWPLYIAYAEDCNLGKPAFLRQAMGLNWNFNASLLEEFISRGVVNAEKAEEFREKMGDPTEKVTVFVLTPEFANFVFVDFSEFE